MRRKVFAVVVLLTAVFLFLFWLAKPLGWIGVIASRTKRKQMFKRLAARGIAAEELSRLEAPVGIPIGSESPAECAVSILASIIRQHKLGVQSSGSGTAASIAPAPARRAVGETPVAAAAADRQG